MKVQVILIPPQMTNSFIIIKASLTGITSNIINKLTKDVPIPAEVILSIGSALIMINSFVILGESQKILLIIINYIITILHISNEVLFSEDTVL